MSASEPTVLQLLRAHSSAIDALRERGIVRTKNVVGCYGEYLFARALDWELNPNSASAFDATDGKTKFQIKARRVSRENPSRQLGDMPRSEDIKFDVLAGVIFDSDFEVICAALIPAPVLISLRTGKAGRPRFHLRDKTLKVDGVKDVTARLRAAQVD